MSKPIHIARVGAVRVPVLRNGADRYCVAWRAVAGGPRKRETFSGKDGKRRAIARADEIACAIASSNADVLTLTAADRDTYRLALQMLAPLGVPLFSAVEDYVRARKAIAPHSLHEATACFNNRAQKTGALPPTTEIVASMLAEIASNPSQRATAGYLRTIKPRLLAIAAAFPALEDATAESVSRFLRTLTHKGAPISPKTFNHYRSTVSLLWRHAAQLAAARKVSIGTDPAAAVKRLHAPGKREVFTAAEMRALLDFTPAYWIPYVTLGAFAGLRVCERERLEWSDIYWKHGEIRIRDEVAGKRGTPRNVPICDALRAWLFPHSQQIGRIYDLPPRGLEIRAETFHEKCTHEIPGFRWKANGLRHSFGSYHLAKFQSLELTRTIMGTGMAMLKHHYHSSQFRDDAEAFWSILPTETAPGKVVSIVAA